MLSPRIVLVFSILAFLSVRDFVRGDSPAESFSSAGYEVSDRYRDLRGWALDTRNARSTDTFEEPFAAVMEVGASEGVVPSQRTGTGG